MKIEYSMTESRKRLRPMKRLRRTSAHQIQKLARHFERRANGIATAANLASRRTRTKPDTLWKDIDSVREGLEMAHALYQGGRLTSEQYFFHCLGPVESLHEHLSMQGDLRRKLDAISRKIDEINAKYGLKPDESWRRGKGPAEFQRENALYEKTLDDAFEKLLRELGLRTHARLWRGNRPEFDRLREAGRAALFDSWDIENATMKLIELYEGEATRCAGAKAYYAACVMLGSSSEALLLLKCLQEPTELAAARAALPNARGFHKDGPHRWNLNQLVAIAKQAGWISDVETQNVVVHIVNLMAQLHDTRNLVHPGRHAHQRPHISIGKEQYEDARAAYATLRLVIERTIRYDLTPSWLRR